MTTSPKMDDNLIAAAGGKIVGISVRPEPSVDYARGTGTVRLEHAGYADAAPDQGYADAHPKAFDDETAPEPAAPAHVSVNPEKGSLEGSGTAAAPEGEYDRLERIAYARGFAEGLMQAAETVRRHCGACLSYSELRYGETAAKIKPRTDERSDNG